MAKSRKGHKKNKTYSKKAKRSVAKNYAKKNISEFDELAKSLPTISLADIPELADYIEEVVPKDPIVRNFAYSAEPPKEIAQVMNQTIGCCRALRNKYVEHFYGYLEGIGYEGGYINDYTVPEYNEMLVAMGNHEYLRKPDTTAYANVKRSMELAINAFNEQYVPKGRQYTKKAIKRANNGGDPLTFRDLKGMPKFHAKYYCVDSYKSNKVGGNIKLIVPEGEEIYDKEWHHGNYKHFRVQAKLKLPKLPEFDVLIHRPMPEGSKIKTVVVTHEKSGEYTVTITVAITKKVLRIKNTPEAKAAVKDYLANHPELALGLDYSQQEGCVGSDEETVAKLINLAFGKDFRHKVARLAALQRKLSKKQRPNYKEGTEASNSYLKLQQQVAKLHAEVAHRRKDALEKLSTVFANSFLLVAVEDIDLRAMSQTLKLAKNLLDNGFGMFREMLNYKLKEQGKLFVKINKWYASTQTCNFCGCKSSITKDMKVKDWECPNCGSHHGRDLNAAKNIRDEGIRTLENAKLFEVKKPKRKGNTRKKKSASKAVSIYNQSSLG